VLDRRCILRGNRIRIAMAEQRKAKRTNHRRHELVMTSNRGFTSSGEALISCNADFQSTKEEHESSREKLQLLNDQLARVNRQLQKALQRERTIGSDLKNILNSSDIATLIADEALNIRFFTPHAAPLFMDATDAGRPLADLAIRFTDINLIADARAVLESCTPIKRETKSASGAWYLAPYQTRQGGRTVAASATTSCQPAPAEGNVDCHIAR
jgi:two-component system, chemotaxis family, CheB/CheR fusion protein